jgi:WD40 repeat protein
MVRVWDIDSKTQKQMLRGHTWEVTGVTVSPDGRYLASAAGDGLVKLWELATGKLVTNYRLGRPVPKRASFSPGGKQLAIAAGDVVRLAALPMGPFTERLTGSNTRIDTLAVSPNGRLIALGTREKVLFRDLNRPSWRAEWGLRDTTIFALTWSPDGKVLLAGGGAIDTDDVRKAEPKLKGFEVRLYLPGGDGSGTVRTSRDAPVAALAYNPAGSHVATGGTDGTVMLWEVETDPGRVSAGKGKEYFKKLERTLATPQTELDERILAIGFSPDGQILVAAKAGGVYRWSSADGKALDPLPGVRTPITAAALVAGGRELLVASDDPFDRRGRRWDMVAGRPIEGPGLATPDTVEALAQSGDGRTVATGSDEGLIRLWDVQTGHERANLTGHSQPVVCLSFAGGDRFLVSGSGDGRGSWWLRFGEALLWDATPLPSSGTDRLRFIDADDASATSRAVVVRGNLALTSQLLPLDGRGRLPGKGDPGRQIRDVFNNLERVLAQAGVGLDALVKLNVYVSAEEVAERVRRVLPRRLPAGARPALGFVTMRLPHPEAVVAVDAVFVPLDRALNAVQHRAVADLSDQPGSSHLALMPAGERVYVSGQAEKGDLATGTRKTLESLRATLKHLRLTDINIVQVKAFLTPMKDIAVVEKEMTEFFGKGRVPPLVFVEWQASPESPIEIELLAWVRPNYFSAPDVIDYLTPPGMTASPIFSRVSRVHYGPAIYISGLYSRKETDAKTEVEDVFAQLDGILKKAGSDLKHLAKATYYVSSKGTSDALNELRPKYYDPKRPPAASKALVVGVGKSKRALTMDMIAVPTLKVPESPPEVGHGLTAQEAAEGWISLFDGESTFGWKDGVVEEGMLGEGETTSVFGNCALKADFAAGGTLTIGGKEITVKAGPFSLAETGGKGTIKLGQGVKLRSLTVKPLGLKVIFNGKDLQGWKRIDRQALPEERRPRWRVEKEAIVATGGPGALEYEKEKFGNFILQIDVKTRSRHANGGVFFRSIPGDFMNGYEAQVYNRCVEGDPSKPVQWATGGIDDRQNARRLISRDFIPYRMTVTAQGPHLATWINGYQVTDWTDTRRPDANPRRGLRPQPGTLQLQAHDPLTDLEYKNIQIVEVP